MPSLQKKYEAYVLATGITDLDRFLIAQESGGAFVSKGLEYSLLRDSVLTNTSRPNLLINGDLRVAQRGTSLVMTPGVDKYLIDRWRCTSSTASTYSQQAFTPGQTDVSGEPKNFARLYVTSGGDATTGAINLAQPIEDVRTLAGQWATLSFYARADAVRNVAIEVVQRFGAGGSPSISLPTLVKKQAITASWVKYSLSFLVPAITGKTIGTTEPGSLDLVFWVSAGSNYAARTDTLGIQTGTFDFALVKLESGKVATPFDIPTAGTELAKCQRYYEVVLGNLSSRAIGYGTDYFNHSILFNVEKRIVSPTTAFIGTPTFNNLTGTPQTGFTFSVGSNSTFSKQLNVGSLKTAHGLTDGYINLGNGVGISVDAEIY